jgi:ribonuclease HII
VDAISAASILAKVLRDREMLEYHTQYPEYGFGKHKGYATKEHLLALQNLGVTPLHRKNFMPIKILLEKQKED